ncbi:hypothetical protein M0802_003698 [Mischocyttarus mexicanus]|nr:hypothetical protein M0802_003698 [Mischocyttarus mexicanus]
MTEAKNQGRFDDTKEAEPAPFAWFRVTLAQAALCAPSNRYGRGEYQPARERERESRNKGSERKQTGIEKEMGRWMDGWVKRGERGKRTKGR